MELGTVTTLPLWLTLAYTAFMAVLVPVYLYKYGPANFLYFCDVALLLTLAGLWLGSRLLLSVAAVGILLPQMFWLFDFFANCFGWRVSGMTAYMFDRQRPLFLRGLSLFHGWLPLLLLYALAQTGYDARALPIWIVIASVLMLVCYFYVPGPSKDRGMKPVNINYVYGLADDEPQRWMSQRRWFLLVLLGSPVLIYLPTHLVLRYWF